MRDDQASKTARRVAAQRRHFDRVPTDYGDPDADQLLHEDVAEDLPFTSTALTAYLVARTRFFDQAVVDALAGGIPQVVVVGAGYDGRSLRYSKPGVRWFELDHPATLADKSARVDRLGLVADEVAAVGVDFSVDDVNQALADAGHDAERMSLLICEGVTPYLERDVIVGLLRTLAGRAAPGSRLAIDFPLEPESLQARLSREALRSVVKAHGEPFRFELPKAQLGEFLRAGGWELRGAIDPAGIETASSTSGTTFVTADRPLGS